MSGSSERRRRRTFTDEFKADAVALVEVSGGQIAKGAAELNSRPRKPSAGARPPKRSTIT